jgi:hypothetical protein
MKDKDVYAGGFKIETQKQINATFLRLMNDTDELTQQRDELTQQRDDLLNSTIWRATKPLRTLVHVFKR